MPRAPLRFVFFLITGLFWLGAGYFAMREPDAAAPRVQGARLAGAAFAPRLERQPNLPEIAAVELSRHASPTDCWIVIAGTVYDVTGYVDLHPSENQEMESVCGKDGTAAWDLKESGKEKGKPHTRRAAEFLEEYPQMGVFSK